MKIQSIKQICKGAKRIDLYSPAEENDQWISDGCAFYPLYNLPVLRYESICTMFDIPEKKRDKIQIEEKRSLPHSFNFGDCDDREQPLRASPLALYLYGRTLIPLESSQGAIYIDKKYLAPFADAENGVQLYERVTAQGNVYVAVKEGFLLTGIIWPYNVVTQNFVNDLARLHDLSAVTLENSGANFPDPDEQMEIEDEDE